MIGQWAASDHPRLDRRDFNAGWIIGQNENRVFPQERIELSYRVIEEY